MTDMTEMTATQFKTKFTKALRKLDSGDIDIDLVIETMKKIKITKKNDVKRPLTVYNLFMQESLKQVKIDNPHLIQKDVMKESVRLWHIHKAND
jgi:hypothetical protein